MSAAIILAFAAPAYAQMNIIAPNAKYTTQDEVDAAIKQEKDYKATMRKLPDQAPTTRDPWGNVRNSGTAPTDPKTKKKKASTQSSTQ